MKRISTLILLCLSFLAAVIPVSADEDMFNPSLYSAGSMVTALPSYWLANTVEIEEFLKNYPDFQCEFYDNEIEGENFNQIICTSVNNPRARDVIINFYFSGDHAGMTGLQETVFTIGTPHTEDIQEVLEQFWHPEAFPWHEGSDWFHPTMYSLLFRTQDTILRFDLPDYAFEGDKFTTVDLWDVDQSRMGVG
ncbi:MAG: hypothetical protein IJI14_20310 [Anaerolineaceae bacterium]|nr:hypothetical protein [Anaerolineaceae bacterium]